MGLNLSRTPGVGACVGEGPGVVRDALDGLMVASGPPQVVTTNEIQ